MPLFAPFGGEGLGPSSRHSLHQCPHRVGTGSVCDWPFGLLARVLDVFPRGAQLGNIEKRREDQPFVAKVDERETTAAADGLRDVKQRAKAVGER